MNVDEAMRQFADEGEFPREALQWALDNWDDASPRLIAKLRAYAASASGDVDVLLNVIHLCGEKCDSRAYVPLCELIANDESFEGWFGDAVGESLAGILINLCDGDVEPLKLAIESPAGDEFCRAAAMEALAYLVRAKRVLTDDEMRDYLLHLAREMRPRGESQVWSAWAFAIAQLGYETLRAEAARVFARKWIDPFCATLDEFHQDLQLARSDADGMAAFSAWRIGPFGSAIEALENFSRPVPLELKLDSGDGDLDIEEAEPFGERGPDDGRPYVNPFRDVGRNDPCPCGSGKKYKKCCLAA